MDSRQVSCCGGATGHAAARDGGGVGQCAGSVCTGVCVCWGVGVLKGWCVLGTLCFCLMWVHSSRGFGNTSMRRTSYDTHKSHLLKNTTLTKNTTQSSSARRRRLLQSQPTTNGTNAPPTVTLQLAVTAPEGRIGDAQTALDDAASSGSMTSALSTAGRCIMCLVCV